MLPARRARHVKPALQLLSEAGGLRLHLDPRRDTEGYAGTGYRGVQNDYWHTGYKKSDLSLSTTRASIRVATQRWSGSSVLRSSGYGDAAVATAASDSPAASRWQQWLKASLSRGSRQGGGGK